MSFTPGYYRPFNDESQDEVSDTDSDDSSLSGFSDSTARRLDDPRYAIIRTAGPSFNTPTEQLYYQSFEKPMGYDYSVSGDPISSITSYFPTAAPQQTVRSTLFSFRSENRDTNVYPLSTYFNLKTPRVYKNITQIQIVNISFPYFLNTITDASGINQMMALYVANQTGFNYDDCYACLGNSGAGRGIVGSLRGGSFTEQGRTNPTAPSKPLIHTYKLPAGSYDKPDLVDEMNRQLNGTPPFNLISYADHRQLFQTTKQAIHLFNDPGFYYYSPTSRSYLQNISKQRIMQDYLPNAITVTGIPSEREIFVAYFFPVLRAALYTDYDVKFLDLTDTSIGEIQTRALQTFEGLNSDYYYKILYTNVSLLQQLRRVNTFEYNPINHYQWSYNGQTKTISVVHTDLHPSIQKDIQNIKTKHLQEAIAKQGYTPQQFGVIQAKQNTQVAIVQGLFEQVSRALVEVGIPCYKYTADYLAQPKSVVITQPKRSLTVTNSDESLFALTCDVSHVAQPLTRAFPASFGAVTLEQLVQDASAGGGRGFTQPYAQHLNALNQQTPFATLYSSFVEAAATNAAYSRDIAAVTTGSAQATAQYVQSKYGTVFPPSLLTGGNYISNKGTNGVTFYNDRSIHYASSPSETDLRSITPITSDASCCQVMNVDLTNFYSCLPAEYIYNTTYYQLFATTNPNNILNIYITEGLTISPSNHDIYLQLNEEQSLNNMDVGGKENYMISNEGTGECKKVFGKILTAGSVAGGANTQVITQVPARFPNSSPLASLDHFTFNFLLDTMVPLSKLYPFMTTGTEWNAIIQIDELVSSVGP